MNEPIKMGSKKIIIKAYVDNYKTNIDIYMNEYI